MSDLRSSDSLPGLGDKKSPVQELEQQVQVAQEQLQRLQREREQIERQKKELEELRRKQGEFEEGRKEMLEKLNRAVVILEREAYEAHKRHEQLTATRASFLQHLDELERINPELWDKASLGKEVSRALSAVEDARTDYSKSRSKINAVADEEVIGPEASEAMEEELPEHGFAYWLKAGLGFTLPLLVALLLLALVLWLRLLPQ